MKFAKRLAPVCILAGCLAALWFGRSLMVDAGVRQGLIPALERGLPGLQLTSGRVRMDGLSRFEVNALAASYCLGGDCLTITVPEARFSCSLSGLLPWRGLAAFFRQSTLALRGAAVSGVVPAALFSPDTPYVFPALPALPAIAVSESALDLRLQGAEVKARGLGLSAPPFAAAGPDDPLAVTLTAESLAVNHPGWPARQGSLAATLRYLPGRLEVPTLSFDQALLLEDGALNAEPDGLHFSMMLRLLQSQGRVRGEIGLHTASLDFHLAEADLKALSGAAGVAAPVGGHLRADGELSVVLGQSATLKGTVSASVRDGAWQGVPVERLTFGLRAAEGKLTVERLEMEMGKNRIAVRDSLLPIPELSRGAWLQLLKKSRGAAELDLTDLLALPPSWSAWLLKDWQAMGIARLTAAMTLADGQLLVPRAEAAGRAGQVWATEGKVDLGAKLSAWQALPWRVSWRAELTDAAVIRHFWEPWPASGGTVSGQGTFSGTLAEPHLPFSATFTGSTLYGVPLAKVAGEVEWTRGRMALDVRADSGTRDWLTYQGSIDLDEGGLLATRVAADVADLAPYLPPAWTFAPELSGPLASSSTLAGPFSALSGELRVTGDLLVQGARFSAATMESVFERGRWSVRRLETTLNNMRIAAAGSLAPTTGWRGVEVGFADLSLAYEGKSLALVEPGGLRFSASELAVTTPLVLGGDLGRFRIEGHLGDSGEALRVTGDKIRDTGLLRAVSGKEIGFAGLDFTLDLSGPPSRLAYRCQGRVEDLTAVGEEFLQLSGVFDVAYDEQGLWLTKFEWTDADQSISMAGHLPVRYANGTPTLLPQPLDLKVKVSLPHGGLLPRLFPEWLAASRAVDADLSLGGSWQEPSGQVRLSGAGLQPGPRLSELPAGPYAVTGSLAVDKEELTITRLSTASPELTLEATGGIRQLALARLLAGQSVAPAGAEVAVRGRFASTDLGWLAAKVPGLLRTAGTASGTFALTGPLSGPRLRADLAVQNGQARGSDSLLVARDISLDAAFEHDRLTIAGFSGTLGGAPVSGSGTIKEPLTADRQLDLKLTGKDLLLYRADGVKLRADARLELTGTGKAPQLGGELQFTDSRITKKVNWLSFLRPGVAGNGDSAFALFSFKDEPLKSTRLNLTLKAARPLVIANNVFKGTVRPDLTLTGSGELPSLAGVVYVDTGSLTLPSGHMDMENGLVRFREEETERPQLQLQATGRMMGYDIMARLSGPYDEPEVALSSVPPLANEDLLMLMLTGRQPLASGQPGSVGGTAAGVSPPAGTTASTGASTNVAVYFGRGLLSRLFSGEEEEFQLLDRLELDIGRAVTQQGEETVEARFRLADRFWKSDTSLYLTADRDMWDYYNGGLRVVFHLQ